MRYALILSGTPSPNEITDLLAPVMAELGGSYVTNCPDVDAVPPVINLSGPELTSSRMRELEAYPGVESIQPRE